MNATQQGFSTLDINLKEFIQLNSLPSSIKLSRLDDGFRTKSKTTRILMRELLFADDSALVAYSAEEMPKIVNAFSDASKKFGLKINIKKTEVLYQSNSRRTREEDIMVDGNTLNSVLEFTYIGSTITSNGCINDEIQRRMAKAIASFGRLR